MKHCKCAARFYRCPTAGKYLIAASLAFPNASLSVQHAYAMHVYARQTNAGGWKYIAIQQYVASQGQHRHTVIARVNAWKSIQLETLLQYMPYVQACPKVTKECVARYYLHVYNASARKVIAQYQEGVARAQCPLGNWWKLTASVPVPAILKQRLLTSKADRQRYIAAWHGFNPGFHMASAYQHLPYMQPQVAEL